MARRITKPDTVRDLGPVNVDRLAAQVARVTDQAWTNIDAGKENAFACFHHTRHMVFRFIHRNSVPENHYATAIWPVWQPLLQPIMDDVAARFGFARPVFPKAMLARLAAGHEIDRHRDGAGSNLCTHKIHVPLQTNPRAIFYVSDQPFHLAAGRAYEVNNIAPHAVRNDGDADRIHFIFEIYEQDA